MIIISWQAPYRPVSAKWTPPSRFEADCKFEVLESGTSRCEPSSLVFNTLVCFNAYCHDSVHARMKLAVRSISYLLERHRQIDL